MRDTQLTKGCRAALRLVEIRNNPNERPQFAVVAKDSVGREFRCHLAAGDLLRYSRFQARFLAGTNRIFRFPAAERPGIRGQQAWLDLLETLEP